MTSLTSGALQTPKMVFEYVYVHVTGQIQGFAENQAGARPLSYIYPASDRTSSIRRKCSLKN